MGRLSGQVNMETTMPMPIIGGRLSNQANNPNVAPLATAKNKSWENLTFGEKIWGTIKEIPKTLYSFIPPSIKEYGESGSKATTLGGFAAAGKGVAEFGLQMAQVTAQAIGGGILEAKQLFTKKPESINLPILGEVSSYERQAGQLVDAGFSPEEAGALVGINAYLGFMPLIAKGVKTAIGTKIGEFIAKKEIPFAETPEGIKAGIKATPVAQKGLPETIPAEKGIIPQEPQPLAQEAKPTFQFVSPNVETGLDYTKAVSRLETPEHLAMKSSFRRIDDELFGIGQGKTHSAAGDWIDGAENTTYFVGKNVDKDTLVYSTAVKSKIAYQKQGIWFKAGDGIDELYQVSIEGKNPAEVKKVFDKVGVQYKTIGKHEALIFNKSGDYFDTTAKQKLGKALDELGIAKWDEYKGEGEFKGSFLEEGKNITTEDVRNGTKFKVGEKITDEMIRKDAMRVYDNVIRNWESRTGKFSNVLREEAMASVVRGTKSFNEFINKFQRVGDRFSVSFNQ